MAYSRLSFTYSGDNDFDLNFAMGYSSRSDISCYIKGTETEVHFDWLSDSRVRINPQGVSNGDILVFERTVSKRGLPVNFNNASKLTRENIEKAIKYAAYMVHEVYDGRTDQFDLSEEVQEWVALAAAARDAAVDAADDAQGFSNSAKGFRNEARDYAQELQDLLDTAIGGGLYRPRDEMVLKYDMQGGNSNPNAADGDYVDLYVKGSNPYSNRYIRWRFERYINPEKYADDWRVSSIDDATRTGTDTFTIGQNLGGGGEREIAIKEVGASDYMGGRAHGFEANTRYEMFLDGRKRTLVGTGTLFVNRFSMFQTSDLTRVEAPHIRVAEVWGRYELTPDWYEVTNHVKFDEAVTLQDTYLAMFAMRRFASDGSEITTRGYAGPKWELVDLSSDLPSTALMDSTRCTMDGSGGYSFEAEVMDGWINEGRTFHFSPQTDKNKAYWDFFGNNYTTYPGEELSGRVRFAVRNSN